jgi:hypothetical protein
MIAILSPWADAVIGLGLAFSLVAAAELLACAVERQVPGGPVRARPEKSCTATIRVTKPISPTPIEV